MNDNGLLYRGSVVPVPGLNVHNIHNADWAKLSTRDFKLRSTSWIRQIILHTTKGIWPQKRAAGAGPAKRAELVAHYWQNDPTQSAAHIVIGSDGEVACLADLFTTESFHATTSNDWSVGIEIYQEADGTVYQAAYDAALVLVPFLANLLEFPLQLPSRTYNSTIIERMKFGGPDCVGVFGHRDQSWKFPFQMTPEQRKRYPDGYASRGRGDPGDDIYSMLRSFSHADAWDYEAREDVEACRRAQLYLNAKHSAGLSTDGQCGPKTYRALRAHGFSRLSEITATS